MTDWSPQTIEDELLEAYHRDVGNVLVTEVSVPIQKGNKSWPDGYSNRFIDGVRLLGEHTSRIETFSTYGSELLEHSRDAAVEVIEVKQSLNRPVIGQVIAGADLFAAEFEPRSIQRVVVCSDSEPALEWVCEQRGIRVHNVDTD